ncbi:FAD-binding oxidoreductase [Antribacter gilvus]|uniref:FAD-binding oxidoreductase n=1 Tax=Antribacter gilvus TaxID=2304675 RepID=UPI000F77B032|nr:FAD-binding oxidoreductase [Antribacter gilvus]
MTTDYATDAARELSEQIGAERVLQPGDAAYDETLPIWNGAVRSRPAVVVRPGTTAHVQAAVRAAVAHGLSLSVRGGGHDWAGRSLSDGGLTIDLSAMRSVTVDATARVAVVSGGALIGDVIAAAAGHGLAAATGTVGAVGFAGLTLGGGYGPLGGIAGLALDNLLGADVVLADGRLVSTDKDHEPELFWALRGGGGNFGVVTSLRVRLHEVSTVLAGFVFFPWDQAADVWRGYAELVADAPDELTVQTGVLSGPDGSPLVLVSPVWSGDPADGAHWAERVRQLGTPVMSQLAPMTYQAMLSLYDAHIANGRHYTMRTRALTALTDEAIAVLVEAGATRTSPTSGVVVHHFHGAATRVAPESTAFGLRQPHLMLEILSAWEPSDQAATHEAWADHLSEALRPHALPWSYPNVLGPDATDQIADAYGANTARLLAAKRRFDPDGVFTAIPLPAA